MNTYFYTLLSVFAVSAFSFVGILTLSLRMERLQKITLFLVSLSAGTLLGDAFIHILPETLAEFHGDPVIWLSLLAGILLFFVLEKIVCWRHCHVPTTEEHPHHLGIMNLVGDALHNLIDGIVIASSFMAGPAIGWATTIAIIAHEIPQEIADFGVLIHAGYSRAKALTLNFIIALAAIFGALATMYLGSQINGINRFVLPFTAGGFIYIATADLIPELKKEPELHKSLFQLLSIMAGLGIMIALKAWM